MSFRFSGLSGTNTQRKPKKVFGRQTGLFGRNLGDDLKSRHEGDTAHPEDPNPKPNKGRIAEKRKDMFLRGLSDKTMKYLAFLLVVLIVIAIIIRLLQVFGAA